MNSIQTILLATDFSEPANQAHLAACEMTRKMGARLFVVHVTSKPVVSELQKSSELNPAQMQDKLWETLQWPRESEAGLDVQHRVAEGEPVAQITAVAREVQADLLVIGTHGPRGFLNWFKTNITDGIIREAPCSILVVKTPPAADIPM